jgi:2-succinyl-6-hydroxy-2,4-cyclohexadiene-1-carboxylate synthase
MGSAPAHLAGYSLGARLALGIAVRHPERVSRLTLVGAHPGLASDTERDERRRSDQRWIELLETCGIDAFVDAWSAQPLFASERRLPEALRSARRKERLGHDPKELARSLRITGLAEMPNFRPRLGEIRAPVTLMTGELDAKFSALAEEVSNLLPS